MAKERAHHTHKTIKGFQENLQQSECFAAVAKNVLKLKICNIFEPLWFVQNFREKTKVDFFLRFFAISVFWCLTWILLKLLIFWTCVTCSLLCDFLCISQNILISEFVPCSIGCYSISRHGKKTVAACLFQKIYICVCAWNPDCQSTEVIHV